MSKDLLVLADEYAAATATFARSLALKDGTDSMSPIAREAGDKRAVLAEALAALDTAQPVQVNAMLVEAAEYLSNIVLTHMTDYPLETEARVSEWNHHQEAITAAQQAQPVPEVNEWKDAVTDALVVAHILTPENAIYPRKAVQDVIDWNCQVALDPRVSSKAQALVDSGKSVQVNAGYGELEAVMSAEFESHGFGAPESNKREYGRFRVGFASGWHSALTAAKQAQPVCGYDDTTGNCTRVNCCKQAQPERAPMTEYEKMDLVTNWFSEDWSIKKAVALLEDYEARHGIKQGGQQ